MLDGMISSLRGKILARLLLVAVSLASIAGGGIYFLERRSIDQRVFALALEETRSLVGHLDFLAEPRQEDFDQVNRRIAAHVLAEHIDEGHFVAIEIYDLERKKVVEAIHPDFRVVEEAVDASHLTPRAGEQYAHAWMSVGGVSYVQVVAPLQVDRKTMAYFDGTYRVDPEAMRQMNRGLALSVLLVMLVVLATAMVLYPIMLRLNGNLLRLTDDLAYANMGMLAALGSAVARRDRGTNAHNYRVTIYAIHLARALGLSVEQIRGLVKGAFLHDVGKIGIADAILRKPARLTPEEILVMQAHVRYGVEMVGKFEWLKDAVDVVRSHHERFDGLGYPAGLRGEEIPISARIFAVVDVFDALTTRRPYKAPIPFEETMRHLEEGRGSHFDPDVLNAFESIAPELFRTSSGADELQLTRILDRLMVHYFPAPRGGHGPRGPLQLGLPSRVTGTASEVALTPFPFPVTAPTGEKLGYLSGTWSLEGTSRGQPPPREPSEEDTYQDDPFRDFPAGGDPPVK
jgi:putative nucleotidyltransferase with HDIG domain